MIPKVTPDTDIRTKSITFVFTNCMEKDADGAVPTSIIVPESCHRSSTTLRQGYHGNGLGALGLLLLLKESDLVASVVTELEGVGEQAASLSEDVETSIVQDVAVH